MNDMSDLALGLTKILATVISSFDQQWLENVIQACHETVASVS
jgi:hypothetical protein